MRIGIVGGGPAGLVAAIAARQAGFEASAFEQAPSFEKIGGAVGIQSNGLRVLDALDLLARFRKHIDIVYEAGLEAPPGRRITYADFRELDIPHNGFAVALRYDLQELLLNAAVELGALLHFNHRCTAVTNNDKSVALSFADAEPADFDVVFACDGIHSAVRASSSFRVRDHAVGEAYLRLVAPIEHPDRSRIGEFWATDGRRAGAFPLPDNRTYVFCSVPIGEWDDIRAHRLDEWVDSWKDFGDPVSTLVRSITDWSTAVYDELHDLRVEPWCRERVVLLGDAAHAMTPNLGQGANCAMVDALVLINLLVENAGHDWHQGASRYEQLRKPFVTRIQNAARIGGGLAAWRSAPARGLRDAGLRFSQKIGPLRRASMRLTAGYNPAEEPYLHPPVKRI